jgi:uncharacterized membrane protein
MTRQFLAGVGAAAIASGWLGAVLCAPVANIGPMGRTLAGITYLLGSLICHQQALRSFHIGGAQLPVCARCLGLYAGAAIGALMSAAITTTESSRRPLALWRMVLIVSALPTCLTLAVEWLSMANPTNVARFTAAIPLGIAGAWLVTTVVRGHLR